MEILDDFFLSKKANYTCSHVSVGYEVLIPKQKSSVNDPIFNLYDIDSPFYYASLNFLLRLYSRVLNIYVKYGKVAPF